MDRHLNHLPITHQNYRLLSKPSQSEAKTIRNRHSLSLTHNYILLFFRRRQSRGSGSIRCIRLRKCCELKWMTAKPVIVLWLVWIFVNFRRRQQQKWWVTFHFNYSRLIDLAVWARAVIRSKLKKKKFDMCNVWRAFTIVT